MLRTSKLLAGMLVAMFVIATFPIADWANSSDPAREAAACHSESPSPPAPVTPSHQCCAVGHEWAFPGSPPILHPVLAQVGVNKETHDLRPLLLHDRPLAFLSDSPPITTSLRI